MNEEEKKMNPYERLKSWMENSAMKETLQKTLPKGASVDAWVTAALTTVRTTKDIGKCEPLSTMGALMTLASLGVRLEGQLGQAYLQARAVKEKVNGQWVITRLECQAGIGYQGLMTIARRDPMVRDIDTGIVYQNDEIGFQRGTDQWIKHTWDVAMTQEERGPMVAVFAGIRYMDGYYSFDIYPIGDVLELRDRILKQTYYKVEIVDGEEVFWKTFADGGKKKIDPDAAGTAPWISNPIPMIKKTSVRWASKYWNMSPDMERATQLIALDDAGKSQGLAQAVLGVLPDHLRHAVEQESGIAADPNNQAIAASRRTGQSLKDRMLAEATGKKDSDDSPDAKPLKPAESEDQRSETEPEDESQESDKE